MISRTPVLRLALRAATAASAVIVAAAGLGGAVAASASVPPAGARANPYSPAAGHPYRHGVLPTLVSQRAMTRWASQRAVPAASRENLSYGGGGHGNGVTSGHEKVYLVFYGSQWGTAHTNSHGDLTLSGDPNGAAPYLQELFKGLGTGGERWSGVMTQYCDGVAYGATSCPANSYHVAYPSGGALAGVWADEGSASPSAATGHQLGTVAIAAAHHFGNNTKASNRDAQYVILSPTGTHPDGFNTSSGQFCAWHDDSADPNLPAGPVIASLDVAFTNLPYVTDAGPSCGENFVNGGAAGVLDGASIVEGHEYAETITDQYPAFGWTNTYTGGEETADLCAWNPPGGTGGTNDLTLPTGTFAMQSTWSNRTSGGQCSFRQPVQASNWVRNGGFEAGPLKYWTTSGSVATVTRAHSGRYAARLGKITPTKGSSSIAQTFTARGTGVSFWYNVNCPDTVAVAWATATLTDNTAHTSVTLLAKTCVAAGGWRQASGTVIAGHSYTLKLISHDDGDTSKGDGAYLRVDDVISR
ncbi:MAG: hypothetical protein ACR2FU_10400 [Streptosporangiaceae bacterium]